MREAGRQLRLDLSLEQRTDTADEERREGEASERRDSRGNWSLRI